MEKDLFHTIVTVRGLTENLLNQIPEQIVDIIPDGFNNNIRWNFGHIAVIQEKLAFEALGEELGLPYEFVTYFAAGTSPNNWDKSVPSLDDIHSVLTEQKSRIQSKLKGRLNEALPSTLRINRLISLTTVAQTLQFSLFHEGMHIKTIKNIQRLIKLKV